MILFYLAMGKIPPVIDHRPQNRTVVVGGTAMFECRFMSDLNSHLQWLRHYQINGSYVNEENAPYVKVIKVLHDMHIYFQL